MSNISSRINPVDWEQTAGRPPSWRHLTHHAGVRTLTARLLEDGSQGLRVWQWALFLLSLLAILRRYHFKIPKLVTAHAC